ncbi:MAG: ABC transporter permease [Eubacteriaceae bacterium]|nr:ABC transporter permease [Eubacteriaceae bacterium]
MAKYAIKRIASSFMTLALVICVVFLLLRQMPIEGYFNNFDKLTPSQIRFGLENLGLNSPIHIQLARFFKNTLKGDLGVSNKYRVNYPITKLIAQKTPVSLLFGLSALAFAVLVGLPLGILMAKSAATLKGPKIADKAGSAFVTIIQSVPQAVYHLFIQIYGTELVNRFTRLPLLYSADNPKTWILPIISLSLANMAMYAMWMRRYMVDESNKDYALLARAKGVSPSRISSKHVFRNAFVPLAQYIPTSLILTLMGSLYVESRYSIPGMGGLLVDAIKRQDNTLVQALVLVFTAVSILGVLVGDLAMAFIDPRIKLSNGGVR